MSAYIPFAIGVFSPSEGRGILVFTIQEMEGQNLGLAYEAGEIRLTRPAKRELDYRLCCTFARQTLWEDLPGEIPYAVGRRPATS